MSSYILDLQCTECLAETSFVIPSISKE